MFKPVRLPLASAGDNLWTEAATRGVSLDVQLQEHDGTALRYVTVEPDGYDPGRPYPMVILLHGYGSHMRDLAGLVEVIGAAGYLYAFPNAPMPIQLGYGARGYAWADPAEGDGAEAAQRSEEMLAAFFEEVIGLYGVVAGQVVLGGFSQGGSMTFRTGLPSPDIFRGLVSLSGKMPEPDTLRARLPAGRAQHMFIAHGTLDQLIPVEEARSAHRFLEAEGYAPEYHEYEMGHEVASEEVEDLTRWLRRVLPPAAP